MKESALLQGICSNLKPFGFAASVAQKNLYQTNLKFTWINTHSGKRRYFSENKGFTRDKGILEISERKDFDGKCRAAKTYQCTIARYSNAFAFIIGLLLLFLQYQAVEAQLVKRTRYDITSYRIDAVLEPSENKLTAVADVTLQPLEEARNLVFELNGSLKVDSIQKIDLLQAAQQAQPQRKNQPQPKPELLQFVQDQVGVSDLGPSVRVDLGSSIPSGQTITLRFKYSGILNTPTGGPLLNKRLAYIGESEGYLMYAARWFPFHDYAADLATADINVTLPGGYQFAASSDTPIAGNGSKFTISIKQPGLIGNFAYGKYTQRTMNIGGSSIELYTKPGFDDSIQFFGETLAEALNFYRTQFGPPASGNRFVVAQIDDESLDFYSARGMLFVASRNFDRNREAIGERLEREAAYQWWGQSVALKSFDDAWLSQGLASYCAFALNESRAKGAQLDSLRRELLEKSLTFEQTASLLRAPSTLDDQSAAYQYIMFGKGAFVFKLLRDTLGKDKFNQLLREFYNKYRGSNASIDDFEKLSSQIAGTNLRYFFARWVEGTGVPEFTTDYQILRTRAGKFVTRGTVKQNYDNLRLPVEIQLRSEGEQNLQTVTLDMQESSADFNIESDGKPIEVVIDPGYQLLRISPELRVSSIARRGIEQMKEGNYSEAQAQFEAALKLDRSNSWVYYNLGLLLLEQRNYDLAIDNFRAALGGNLDPAWLRVWCEIKMGNAYDAKGDRTRAVAAYQRAEKLGDDYNNAQEAVKRYLATPYDPREKQASNSAN
jgi:tetratricopeptide (TPR) repeat protein